MSPICPIISPWTPIWYNFVKTKNRAILFLFFTFWAHPARPFLQQDTCTKLINEVMGNESMFTSWTNQMIRCRPIGDVRTMGQTSAPIGPRWHHCRISVGPLSIVSTLFEWACVHTSCAIQFGPPRRPAQASKHLRTQTYINCYTTFLSKFLQVIQSSHIIWQCPINVATIRQIRKNSIFQI